MFNFSVLFSNENEDDNKALSAGIDKLHLRKLIFITLFALLFLLTLKGLRVYSILFYYRVINNNFKQTRNIFFNN